MRGGVRARLVESGKICVTFYAGRWLSDDDHVTLEQANSLLGIVAKATSGKRRIVPSSYGAEFSVLLNKTYPTGIKTITNEKKPTET